MTAPSPTNEPGGPSTVDDQLSPKRWSILFLLFLSIMINLIDRQVLSVMAPVIRDELGLTNADYSQILFAFLLGLTLFQYPAGWMIDRKGARFGLPLIMFVWSVANGLHAIARNMWHLRIFRFFLGAGECGNYSGGIKVISQWFPIKERALAGGIFNSGTVAGAFLAPLLIVPLGSHFGWRMTFIIPSALGLLWIIPWLAFYRDRTSQPAPAEAQQRTSLLPLLRIRHVWGAILIRALGGPVVHFYWYWLPEYLRRERGFSMEEIGWTAGIPFLFAGLGNLAGGWFSGHLIAKGWPTDRARKAAFLTSAALCACSMAVPIAPSAVTAMALICLATFGIAISVPTHIATLGDLFAARVLARLAGLTGLGEGIMNMILMLATGYVVDRFSYLPVFLAAGLMPTLGLAALFALIRRIERIEV
ncbi:MAG: MFS transporter [Bryobacterales bacterium]|nr:MFS transporter [Bryobacterales bacterium]MDE0292708.1 MFS transporter [Bryobacterales bacterium]